MNSSPGFPAEVQFIWAIFFALLTIPAALDEPTSNRILHAACGAVLLFSAVGCRSNLRWCWYSAVGIEVFLIVHWLPYVVFNLSGMPEIDEPLYHESPGSGLVVLLHGVMFVLAPATAILSLMVSQVARRLQPMNVPAAAAVQKTDSTQNALTEDL